MTAERINAEWVNMTSADYAIMCRLGAGNPGRIPRKILPGSYEIAHGQEPLQNVLVRDAHFDAWPQTREERAMTKAYFSTQDMRIAREKRDRLLLL